jgi:HK97 family phage major capsid protein
MISKLLPAETAVRDEGAGVCDYVVSTEDADRDQEIIRLSGWQFNHMPKNAPLIDSHRYGSIENQVGKVLGQSLEPDRLVETVQWAVDVPENRLAQLGWAMTKAGYLKGVSPGFFPIKVITQLPPADWPNSWSGAQIASTGTRAGRQLWQQQGADLRRDISAVKTIYVEQEQHELSVCILGANPNAVAKSYKDGILSDADLDFLSREYARRESHGSFGEPAIQRTRDAFLARIEKALGQPSRSYSFPTEPLHFDTPEIQKTLNMNLNFLNRLSAATGASKSAFEQMETARRSGSDSEMDRAIHKALLTAARERRAAAADAVEAFFRRNPEQRLLWGGIGRHLGGGRPTPEEAAVLKAWVPGDAMGAGMFPIPVSPDLFDLLLIYGAFRDLGVREMLGQYTKFAKVTGLPSAVVASPSYQGTYTIPADTTLAGAEISEASNTFAVLLQISLEWLNDVKLDIGSAVISKVVPGLAKAVDFCAFLGTGDDDLTSATQTGIFMDANIASYTPTAVGKTNILALERFDFINTVGTVAPAALQRPCRWYIYPGFIPLLMQLKDGPGDTYLLRSPAMTGSDEWVLCGFPVTWTAQAPAVNQGQQKIAAFGEPSSYTVAIRTELEMMSSDGASFTQAMRNVRAIMRGKCLTREATGFATLKLAAQ